MAFLTPEQRKKTREVLAPFKKLVNVLWAWIIFSILAGLAARHLWSGYPPVISWLEPWFEFSGIVGLLGAALLIARKNPLFKAR